MNIVTRIKDTSADCMLSSALLILCLNIESLYGQGLKEYFRGGSLEAFGENEVMVFNDEFDGNSLDTSRWLTYFPYGPGGSDQCAFCRTHDTSMSAQVFLDKNLIVKDGYLTIRTLREQVDWMGKKADFSAGVIHSRQTFNDYYKYEIRCKIPEGKIFWPAFWMFGWSTELDVFEFMSPDTRYIYFNVHKWIDGKSTNRPYRYKGKDFSKDFHIYAVAYEPYFVRFYIDGRMIHQIPKFVKKNGRYSRKNSLKEGTYYLNPVFPNYGDHISIIANNAVSRYRTADPDLLKKTTLPADMIIDYIRVYKNVEP